MAVGLLQLKRENEDVTGVKERYPSQSSLASDRVPSLESSSPRTESFSEAMGVASEESEGDGGGERTRTVNVALFA